MSDGFEVSSSTSTVITELDKPDDWDELELLEQLQYVQEALDDERTA